VKSGLAVGGDPDGVASAVLGAVGQGKSLVKGSSLLHGSSLVEGIVSVVARSADTDSESCGDSQEFGLHVGGSAVVTR
jgi:hypothetical protein